MYTETQDRKSQFETTHAALRFAFDFHSMFGGETATVESITATASVFEKFLTGGNATINPKE